MDNTDGILLSNKIKSFLNRRLEESQQNLLKLKQKRKIVKGLYFSTTLISIAISATLASISLMVVPPNVITILATLGGILTAVSIKFNLEEKNFQISCEIEKLDKLKNKLDYVISCNGTLSERGYHDIISEFT
jgi:hypothetical protein